MSFSLSMVLLAGAVAGGGDPASFERLASRSCKRHVSHEVACLVCVGFRLTCNRFTISSALT